jgi:hypothetical protein
VADRCLFFEDLLRVPGGSRRTFELHERPGTGLSCVDVRLRTGRDWCFARRWIRAGGNARELYRTIDRLEDLGFRFHVRTQRSAALSPGDLKNALGPEPLDVRASLLLEGLTPEERRLHAELFPEEHALLARGYDWDAAHVYRHGQALGTDAFGRVLDADGDVLYEWVRIEDELTWRRYPLERLRPALTARGR